MGAACTKQPSFSRRSETGSLPLSGSSLPEAAKGQLPCTPAPQRGAASEHEKNADFWTDVENRKSCDFFSYHKTPIRNLVILKLQSSRWPQLLHGWMHRFKVLRAHELLDNLQGHRSGCVRCSGYELQLPPASSWRLMKLSAVAWPQRRTSTKDHSSINDDVCMLCGSGCSDISGLGSRRVKSIVHSGSDSS